MRKQKTHKRSRKRTRKPTRKRYIRGGCYWFSRLEQLNESIAAEEAKIVRLLEQDNEENDAMITRIRRGIDALKIERDLVTARLRSPF
jgi:hypothetical protein